MEEKKAVFKKFPYLMVIVSVIGITVIVLEIISSIGKVKFFAYFGFFMNLLFYANILQFGLKGYKSTKAITKKPVKNMLKSFCILLFMVTIMFQPIIVPVAITYGIAICFLIFMMFHVKDYNYVRVLVFVILGLLIAAAIIKLSVYGNIPAGSLIVKGAWAFNVFSQVIQWLAFGMTYILRFSEFKKAGYLE